MARYSEAVEPGTVWTWNAIGKSSGSWHLDPAADESKKGFLLNHLISDELPVEGSDRRLSNSDPITGQAGWYDVRVRIFPANSDEPHETFPSAFTAPASDSQPNPKELTYRAESPK